MTVAIDLPDVARRIDAIRSERSALIERAVAGVATASELDRLASLETSECAFADMCRRTSTACLMATGLRWGDQLRHPTAPGEVAEVRLADLVLFRGVEVDVVRATAMVGGVGGHGPAVADWTGPRGIRLGDALGLEHPPRPSEPSPPAQSSLF